MYIISPKQYPPNCDELRCLPSIPAHPGACLSPLRCRTVSDNVRWSRWGRDLTNDGRRTATSSRLGKAAEEIQLLCFGEEL